MRLESKTRNILKSELDKFCERLLPETKDLFKKNAFVAGGAISTLITNESFNDLDVYFESYDDLSTFCTHYVKIDELVKIVTENAISFDGKVQVIKKYWGDPVNMFHSFDFQHLHGYYNYDSDELIIPDYVYRLIANKELIYTGSEFPVNSLLRIRKYLKRGWNIHSHSMLKIVFDIIKAYIKKHDFHKWDVGDDIKAELGVPKEGSTIITEDLNFSPDPDNTRLDIDIDWLIEQLNGVDPITILERLEKLKEQNPTINIDNLLEDINLFNL